MASFNKVILIGNLVADPELKKTPNDVSVVSVRLAVSRKYRAADGTTPTDFIDVVCWRSTAEFVAKYFTKGSPMLVCGLAAAEKLDRSERCKALYRRSSGGRSKLC